MKNRLMRSLHMKALSLALLLPCLDAAAVTATGGTESTIPGYKVHAFTTTGSNSFSVAEGGYVDILLVGGGGGGGTVRGGGGGGGGFVQNNRIFIVGGSNYTVIVGAGGLGAPSNTGSTGAGSHGDDSSFSGRIAYGGGGGRNDAAGLPNPSIPVGSGGGMGTGSTAGPCPGTDGQGHAGGKRGAQYYYAGSGGGAGAVGEGKNGTPGSTGGAGRASFITGTEEYYAGGGGGSTHSAPYGVGGPGGLGGGGAGSYTNGVAGVANTGGGGGGGGSTKAGGDGGSGLVIIRYQSADSLLTLGFPENYGTPTPPYGITNGLTTGDAFSCSVPTGWLSLAAGTRADCSGYQLFTNDVLAVADATNAFSYTHASYGSLIWQWRRQHEITFSAGTGGIVSTSGGWYNEDSSVTVTATVTDPRRQFSYWTGDVPAGLEDNATLTFPADRPRTISAYFGGTYHVSTNGSDAADGLSWGTARRTIPSALADAQDGDTVLVSNGTYSVTAQLFVTNGIALRSANGADKTTIQRGSNRCRILSIAHADAVVDGFTITGGFPDGWTAKGGGIFIDQSGGSVSNCIITANQVRDNGMGAGVYLSGGSVKHCQIINNKNDSQYSYPGGGVYLSGAGIVEDCIIADNYRNGAYLNGGGVLRNCLIYGNSTWWTAGVIDWAVAGGVHLKSGGTIENCTIVDNYGSLVGGLACEGGGTVLNSMIQFNRTTAGGSPNTLNTGSGWTYRNCSTLPAVTGTGNITNGPEFWDAASHNYRLLPGSSGIDAGTNQLWMETAVDLDGNQRRDGAFVDMGAYEFITGALDCSPNGTPTVGLGSNEVIFTAGVTGTNTASLYYKWDFDANGTFEIEGADKAVVTHTYTAGLYAVRLVVNNGIGEIADRTRQDYIKVGPAIAYVSTNSTPAYPFTSWATAANSIQAAIDAGVDGTTVLVSNGVYGITSHVTLEKGITMQSVNGPTKTIVTRTGNGSSRIFYISHTNAIVDGFTASNGLLATDWNSMGGGILIDGGGLVSNCHILRNKLDLNSWGCGVYLNKGGTLKNCRIAENTSTRYAYQGGGIYIYKAGVAENCIIEGNYQTSQSAAGTGAYLNSGGLLRNCLVSGNTNGVSSISPAAGGVHCAGGGIVENCTIVSNVSLTAGGTVCAAGGAISNSIVYFNKANAVGNDNYVNTGTGWSFGYTCTTPAVAGTGNIEDDPLFVNPPYNYRLKHNSPCFNSGLKQPWMDTATDLDGLPRLQATKVDRGAYEYVPPTGTRLIIR